MSSEITTIDEMYAFKKSEIVILRHPDNNNMIVTADVILRLHSYCQEADSASFIEFVKENYTTDEVVSTLDCIRRLNIKLNEADAAELPFELNIDDFVPGMLDYLPDDELEEFGFTIYNVVADDSASNNIYSWWKLS